MVSDFTGAISMWLLVGGSLLVRLDFDNLNQILKVNRMKLLASDRNKKSYSNAELGLGERPRFCWLACVSNNFFSSLSTNLATPPLFVDLLVALVEGSRLLQMTTRNLETSEQNLQYTDQNLAKT